MSVGTAWPAFLLVSHSDVHDCITSVTATKCSLTSPVLSTCNMLGMWHFNFANK